MKNKSAANEHLANANKTVCNSFARRLLAGSGRVPLILAPMYCLLGSEVLHCCSWELSALLKGTSAVTAKGGEIIIFTTHFPQICNWEQRLSNYTVALI